MFKRNLGSPAPLVLSGLVTLLFVGCFSDVQSLNSAAEAGFGGEEGGGIVGGSGGTAGSAGTAGKGSAGKGTAGKSGSSATGGSSQAGSSTGGDGTDVGGSTNVGGSTDVGGSAAVGGDAINGGAGTGGTAGGPNNGGAGSGGTAGVNQGGAGNGGAGNGGVGGGSGGSAGFFAGSGGGESCDSKSGSGCSENITFCVDTPDGCLPSDPEADSCDGLCAVPYAQPACDGFGGTTPCPDYFECLPDVDSYFGTDPHSRCIGPGLPECTSTDDCPSGFLCLNAGDTKRCLPALVACSGGAACPEIAQPQCPAGYRHAVNDDCVSACIPVDHCACETDADCAGTGTCDLGAGQCRLEKAPSPRCFAPVEANPCNGTGSTTYVQQDGECLAHPCATGPNSFNSLSDCLSACFGMPLERACPSNFVATSVCQACGGGGGCVRYGTLCARSCDAPEDCESGEACLDDICQLVCF